MAASVLGEVTQQHWNQALTRVIDLSQTTIRRNADLEQDNSLLRGRVHELEMEIRDLRRAHNVHLSVVKCFEVSQDPLILCVLDGDSIFAPTLIAEGQIGGSSAAQQLTKAIAEYLSKADVQIFGRLSFWVTLFYYKADLLEKLRGVCSQAQLEGFLAGFSQSSPRFCNIEVFGNDSVQSKVQEYLQTYTRFPQTLKVFFGGNRSVQAAIDRDVLNKVVMLEPYNGDGNNPNLALNFNALFVPQPNTSSPIHGSMTSPSTSVGMSMSTMASPVTRSAQYSPHLIDPSLPLHKHQPPPCNEFFLMKACSKGDTCKYSHRYILSRQDLVTLASNAKKAPCNWLKNGLECPNGTDCCWGHVCPNGSSCFHYNSKKCWFKADGMHPPLPPTGRLLH